MKDKRDNAPFLRVLCLHGGMQSAEIFRHRLTKLTTKSLSLNMEFVYMNGPHEYDSFDGNRTRVEECDPHGPLLRTWYTFDSSGDAENTNHCTNPHRQVNKTSITLSLDTVKSVWETYGPFDGILGFSAGATLIPYIASDPNAFPGLYFVCIASAATLNLDVSSIPSYIASLHLVGDQDELVHPETSLQLLRHFHNPQVYNHDSGHCIPQRKADRDVIYQFFQEQARCWDAPEFVHSVGEEFEVLKAIFGSDFEGSVLHTQPVAFTPVSDANVSIQKSTNMRTPSKDHMSNQEKYSLCVCRLGDSSSIVGFGRHICLQIHLGPFYPRQRPFVSIVHDRIVNLPHDMKDTIYGSIQMAIRSYEDEPMLFDMIQAANTYILDYAEACVACDDHQYVDCTTLEHTPDFTSDVDEHPQTNKQAFAHTSTKTSETNTVTGGDIEGISKDDTQMVIPVPLPIDMSYTIGQKLLIENISSTRSRGVWRFVVGLIGKPSAGKSTFFNGATRTESAKVGAHPFTTIDANIGRGWWQSRVDGRLLPLLIKDVAGLVPGAASGRGKGNRFLNDLCEADVLVHVVDCSGRNDKNGNTVAFKADMRDDVVKCDPLEDIIWVRAELHAWIYTNIKRKWKNCKNYPKKIAEMFSGYHASKWLVHEALCLGGIDKNISSVEAHKLWTDDVLNRTVSAFLDIRFPIVLACNKMDVAGAESIFKRIANLYPNAVPTCAAAEMHLQRLSSAGKISYEPGKPIFSIISETSLTKKDKLICTNAKTFLAQFECTGVLETLSNAVAARQPVMCYPVDNLDDFAPLVHGYNSNYKHTGKKPYPIDSICLRPGSTVDDVFEILCHPNEGSIVRLISSGLPQVTKAVIGGEYVRAEGCRLDGSDRRLLQRSQLIDDSCAVIRIMATKKSRWQKSK